MPSPQTLSLCRALAEGLLHTHSPWCEVPSTTPIFSKGWLASAAAGPKMGWGIFSSGQTSGETAGAGWSSRLPKQACGNSDGKESLSKIIGRPARHAYSLLPSSPCLLLLPLVFSSPPPSSWSVDSRLSQTLCPRTSPAYPGSSLRSIPLPEPFLPCHLQTGFRPSLLSPSPCSFTPCCWAGFQG